MNPLLIATPVAFLGVAKGAYKIGKHVAGAPDDIEQILHEADEIEQVFTRLAEILERLPDKLTQSLKTVFMLEDYEYKKLKIARKIARLLNSLDTSGSMRNSGIWTRTSLSIKWTVGGRRNKANALMSQIACLKEALLTDCLTMTLEELVTIWLASRNYSREMEAKLLRLQEDLKLRFREVEEVLDNEGSIFDDGDSVVDDEDCGDATKQALNRAHRALRRVDRVLNLYDGYEPFTAFWHFQGSSFTHPPMLFKPENPRLLGWLSDVDSTIPSDVAPSSSCSWPSHASAHEHNTFGETVHIGRAGLMTRNKPRGKTSI